MHMLHKILVPIGDRRDLIDKNDDGALRCVAASRAESETEEFYGRVFDWRETDTAGRWASEYPDGALLSKNGLEKFIDEVREVIEYQNDEIDMHLEELRKTSSDINVIRNVISTDNSAWRTAHHLVMFTKLLTGQYDFDSGFYDVDVYTARADEGTIERIRRCPDEWALVMFDYHI